MFYSSELKLALETAFINSRAVSDRAYIPQFISNNRKEGKKVLSSLENELLACDEFAICVAFITMSGITPLLQTLKELEKRNVPGRILTTDYLHFNQPEALKKLAEYKNIILKMYSTGEAGEGFHTKGYIFKRQDIYRIIVGSSNITSDALTMNREWNTKIVSTNEGEYAKEITDEFEQLWSSSATMPYHLFIDMYTNDYNVIKKQRYTERSTKISLPLEHCLKPNSMQTDFIYELKRLYEKGERRALLISATGDGGIIVSSQAKTA